MLENILRKLDASKQTINVNVPTVRHAIRDQLPFMEIALVEALIDEFIEAMDKIPEYSNSHAQPLRDHLIKNLQYMDGEHPVHVRLGDNGEPIILFDEDFAGTASDFERGRYKSKANLENQDLKYIFWKYGIYKPDVEGDFTETKIPWMRKAMENLPSYDQVIEERLDAWEHTAPYWYFIERGTAGGGKPYPSFPGQRPVVKFRKDAREAIKEFLRGLVDELEQEVVAATERALQQGTPVPPLSKEVIRNKTMTRLGHTIWRNARGQAVRKPRSR